MLWKHCLPHISYAGGNKKSFQQDAYRPPAPFVCASPKATRCQLWAVLKWTSLNRSLFLATRCHQWGKVLKWTSLNKFPIFPWSPVSKDGPGGGGGFCKLKSNTSWVMVTWKTPDSQTETHTHVWKHYLHATSLAGVNKVCPQNWCTITTQHTDLHNQLMCVPRDPYVGYLTHSCVNY